MQVVGNHENVMQLWEVVRIGESRVAALGVAVNLEFLPEGLSEFSANDIVSHFDLHFREPSQASIMEQAYFKTKSGTEMQPA